MRGALALPLALLALSAGCNLKRKPISNVWVDGKLSIFKHPTSAKMERKGMTWTVVVSDLPKKSTVTVAGVVKPVPEGGEVKMSVDVGAQFGAMSIEDFKWKSFDPKIPLLIELPDGKVESTLEPVAHPTLELCYALADFKGGMKFGAEATTPRSTHALAYCGGGIAEVIGSPSAVKDLDWVAVVKDAATTRPGQTCMYTDRAGNKKTAPLALRDREGQIYERLTGRLIDRKKFEAFDLCPSVSSKEVVEGGGLEQKPSNDSIQRWVTERVKKG